MRKLAFTVLLIPGLLAALLYFGSRGVALAQSTAPGAPDRITISGQIKMGTPGLTLPVTTSLLLHAHDGAATVGGG